MMTFKDGQRVRLTQAIDRETDQVRLLPVGALGTVRIKTSENYAPVIGVVWDLVHDHPWYRGLETVDISVRIDGKTIPVIDLCEAVEPVQKRHFTDQLRFRNGQRVRLTQTIDRRKEYVSLIPVGSLGTIRIHEPENGEPTIGVAFDLVNQHPWYGGLETSCITAYIGEEVIQVVDLCESIDS